MYSAAEVARVASEVEVVVCLLKAGCPFYLESIDTPADMNPDITAFFANMLIFQEDAELECGDIAAKELSVTLFKTIPKLLSCEENWRLLLSTMRLCEDVDALMFSSLIEGGALEVLINLRESNYSTPGGLALIKLLDPKRDLSKNSKYANETEVNTSPKALKSTKKGVKDTTESKILSFVDLQDVFYDGFSIAGWAVKLGNIQVLEKILKRGFNLNVSCDILGNNLIHLIAKYGDRNMIDLVCNINNKIEYEIINYYGYTAIMEGVRHGNYLGIKSLLVHGGDSRRGLEAKYNAWLLVLIKKEEKNEKIDKKKFEKKISNQILNSGFPTTYNESSDIGIRKKELKLSIFDIKLLRKKVLNFIMNSSI
jgi:hypothetical protein